MTKMNFQHQFQVVLYIEFGIYCNIVQHIRCLGGEYTVNIIILKYV